MVTNFQVMSLSIWLSHKNIKNSGYKQVPTLKKFIYLNWRIIALQCWFHFCHISAWVSHRCTHVPSLANLPPTSHPFPPPKLLQQAPPLKEFWSVGMVWSLLSLPVDVSGPLQFWPMVDWWFSDKLQGDLPCVARFRIIFLSLLHPYPLPSSLRILNRM